MKKASITEAKNRLSALIDSLGNGSSVLIVDRGRPVARLEPVTTKGSGDSDAQLSRLVREGIVRPSRAGLPLDVLNEPPPSVAHDASAVAMLLKERRESR